MTEILPGTVIETAPENPKKAFDSLSPVFAMSGGGLSMSQITGLTGVGASTVQNWIKRGWVSASVEKKYGEAQVARILLINLLRPAMKLEDIARLLTYINGRVGDASDDIIREPELYNLLCYAIWSLRAGQITRRQEISELAKVLTEDYDGPVPDARERLATALTVMLLNVQAAAFMQRANEIFDKQIGGMKNG